MKVRAAYWLRRLTWFKVFGVKCQHTRLPSKKENGRPGKEISKKKKLAEIVGWFVGQSLEIRQK